MNTADRRFLAIPPPSPPRLSLSLVVFLLYVPLKSNTRDWSNEHTTLVIIMQCRDASPHSMPGHGGLDHPLVPRRGVESRPFERESVRRYEALARAYGPSSQRERDEIAGRAVVLPPTESGGYSGGIVPGHGRFVVTCLSAGESSIRLDGAKKETNTLELSVKLYRDNNYALHKLVWLESPKPFSATLTDQSTPRP